MLKKNECSATNETLLISKKSRLADALKRQEGLLSGLLLSFIIFLVWSWVYHRASIFAWQTPIVYGGDAWLNLGFAKAFMDGDILPVTYKWVAHLNAPFSANWNDYPLSEEFIFAIMGWLGRGVGLFPAANFILFSAHLLAGISFWLVGRTLNYRPTFVFTGALLFAFSHYIFARNFHHIVLSYYWHVPLMLLVSWWAYSSYPSQVKDKKLLVALAVAGISGAFNPYYTGMFLQFLGFAALMHLARKQYRLSCFPLLLLGVTITSFLLMNADTLSYSWLHGPNIQAVSRVFGELERYALKIPELIFPPASHRWHNWAEYGQSHYFVPSIIKGEMGSPYLGIVGLVGLAWLFGTALYRLLQGKLQLIPIHAWQVLWVLLFSLVGGINLLLGTLGFILFRGANRYSIVILAIVLFFLVRQLSRKCPRKLTVPLALGITILGLWDQLPPKISTPQIQQTADCVDSDRKFANELEAQLPRGSMIFQLPVAPFPEFSRIVQMEDYEHFRPYLFTKHLHYSYGTNKGRSDADWQMELSKLAPAEMAEKLEFYGFGAIVINRKGYEDKGVQLVNGLNATREVLAEKGELTAFRLKPATEPESPPIYSLGWSGHEESHRWAISNRAEIIIFNRSKSPKTVFIAFNLLTLKPRNVQIDLNGKTIQNLSLGIDGTTTYFKSSTLTLVQGQNSLAIETDVPPEFPGNGDPREISFGISKFAISEP